ncbi:MAG TPA: mandelate racemase/muconate lactonizing enzyme family protein [Gemmata sp.]|nr:mandelate racemase/muconate lactonizing enzyme family protein [Gemmata sp.]
MKLTRLTTDHLRVPLARPARVPLTDPKPAAGPDAVDLILVRVETDAGVSGLGLTYLPGPGAAAARSLIDNELSPVVLGEDPRDTDRLLAKAEARFRVVGFAGLAARAYCAIDVALWDAKARAAGEPLWRLLGAARPASPYFASDLTGDVAKAAKPLMKQGATGVRVEIGGADVQADAERVREISDALGDDAWVGVAADSRFDLGTAQALAHFFEDIGIDWFEDPIPAADEIGYAKLAGLMETPLAVGSSFASREAFFRVIRAGHVRTIRPDPCRLGGITPLLKVAAVAEAYQVAVSPVRLPEVGVHLACGLGVVPHVDSVSWFRDVFAGGPRVEDGELAPPREPGLGLTVNEDAAKWRVG